MKKLIVLSVALASVAMLSGCKRGDVRTDAHIGVILDSRHHRDHRDVVVIDHDAPYVRHPGRGHGPYDIPPGHRRVPPGHTRTPPGHTRQHGNRDGRVIVVNPPSGRFQRDAEPPRRHREEPRHRRDNDRRRNDDHRPERGRRDEGHRNDRSRRDDNRGEARRERHEERNEARNERRNPHSRHDNGRFHD